MGLVRQDVDAAISESFTFDSFLAALRRQGYAIKYGSNVKHTTVTPPGSAFAFRLNSMGAGHTEADIRERLAAARRGEPYEPPTPELPGAPPILTVPKAKKHYTVQGGAVPRQSRRKLRGFRALYVRYLYLLNGCRRPRRSIPPFVIRKEVTKMDVSAEAADVVVRESLQATEAAAKLTLEGMKNVAALLLTIAKQDMKVVGETMAKRLARDSAPAVIIPIKAGEKAKFQKLVKEFGVLYFIAQKKGSDSGILNVISNQNYAAQLNAVMEQMGYPIPQQAKEEEAPKKRSPAPHKRNPRKSAGVA